MERVRDPLLVGDGRLVERARRHRRGARALRRAPAPGCRPRGRVPPPPCRHGLRPRHRSRRSPSAPRPRSPAGIREAAPGEIELPVRGQPLRVGEHPRARRALGGGEIRIPDRPSIDRTPHEGGVGVGRTEIGELHRIVGDARLLEGPYQQVVDVRALVEGDGLATQVRRLWIGLPLGTRIASPFGAGGSAAT